MPTPEVHLFPIVCKRAEPGGRATEKFGSTGAHAHRVFRFAASACGAPLALAQVCGLAVTAWQ